MNHQTCPQLILGNCLELMKSLPTGSVDLLVCDPPYCTTELAFDQQPIDLKRFWTEVNRICRPNAMQIVFAAQPFTTHLIASNPKNFCYDLVWQKTTPVGFLAANKRPLRAHETMLVFRRRSQSKKALPAIYIPQFTEGKAYTHRARKPVAHYSGCPDFDRDMPARRHPTSVLRFARDVPSLHPTAKPVDLLRWIIRSYSHEGDTVLDCFMGGGSTGEAALKENRRFIGMELDDTYFATASSRLNAEVSK